MNKVFLFTFHRPPQKLHTDTHTVSGKSPNSRESGLECACINNDDFTVLVSGGGRYH